MTKSALFAGVALAAVCVGTVEAQDPLSRLLNRPADLTTGLDNVGRDVPLLDEDDLDAFGAPSPLRQRPRDASGAYTLGRGLYEIGVQSYCLLAGTAGPAHGEGYLAAPLAGPKASIVSAILERSESLPAIPQEQIQSLLWAILSHATFTSLPGDLRSVAAQLLTPSQIASLQADVPGRLSAALRDQLMSRLPPFAQTLLGAETKLRDAFAAGASYKDMAEIAVLDGTPDPQPGDRDVEAGRWNLQDGMLVRYLPEGYSRTTIQVMVPETVTVASDARGRITAMRSPDGWATEVDYDDSVAPLRVQGEAALQGYRFKRITARLPVNGAVQTHVVENVGWAFAGHMTGKGVVPDGDAVAYASGPSSFGQDDPYGDWQSRYKDAKKAIDRSAPLSSTDIDRITDAKHYGKGVKAALGDPAGRISWLQEHMNRLGRAAAYIACRLEGGCEDGDHSYRPRGAAVPGAKGSQRLGLSGR